MIEMKTMIVMLPIDKFDRRMDAEHLENNTLDIIQVNELRASGAAVLELTSFMDICNDQEINLDSYWISYITVESYKIRKVGT
jgi:hypothetical protein